LAGRTRQPWQRMQLRVRPPLACTAMRTG